MDARRSLVSGKEKERLGGGGRKRKERHSIKRKISDFEGLITVSRPFHLPTPLLSCHLFCRIQSNLKRKKDFWSFLSFFFHLEHRYTSCQTYFILTSVETQLQVQITFTENPKAAIINNHSKIYIKKKKKNKNKVTKKVFRE